MREPTLLASSAVEHRFHGVLWSRVGAAKIALTADLALELAALDAITRERNLDEQRLTTSTPPTGALV